MVVVLPLLPLVSLRDDRQLRQRVQHCMAELARCALQVFVASLRLLQLTHSFLLLFCAQADAPIEESVPPTAAALDQASKAARGHLMVLTGETAGNLESTCDTLWPITERLCGAIAGAFKVNPTSRIGIEGRGSAAPGPATTVLYHLAEPKAR